MTDEELRNLDIIISQREKENEEIRERIEDLNKRIEAMKKIEEILGTTLDES